MKKLTEVVPEDDLTEVIHRQPKADAVLTFYDVNTARDGTTTVHCEGQDITHNAMVLLCISRGSLLEQVTKKAGSCPAALRMWSGHLEDVVRYIGSCRALEELRSSIALAMEEQRLQPPTDAMRMPLTYLYGACALRECMRTNREVIRAA